MNRWVFLAFCLSMSAGAVRSEDFRPEVRLIRQMPGVLEIRVAGIWPNSCVPQLVDQVFGGDALQIQTEHGGEACVPVRSAYNVDARFDPESLAAGVYPLRVYSRAQGQPLLRLIAFDLVRVGDPVTGIEPEAGIWWPVSVGANPTTGPGVGFALELQGDSLVLLANLYDALGNPAWMIGTGILDGRIVRTELVTFAGGQPMFSRYSPPQAAFTQAHAHVLFNGRAEATVWLSAPVDEVAGSELLLQPIPIARYAFGVAAGAAGLAGEWVLVRGGLATELALVAGEQPGVLQGRDLPWQMTCTPAKAGGTAVRCELRDPDGSFVALFDQIGLRRLSGADAAGDAVEAFRR